MLQRKYRLKKRTAFTATYRTGVSFHKGGLTVFCGKLKTDNSDTKIGFVVSKKVHKRAVKRNRIKRLIRESLRLYIKGRLDFDTKYMSLVFVGSAKLLDKDYNYVDNIVKKIMSMIDA
ncbi:MAG: ribonuclease P protein component [Cyanobacteria bacterium SIG31]|nr:ribonuclease P protein component [Cyanobacteria bacterium SIG31]